ncbi:MAG TPA: DegT/DnrJ/EryC1/StrS family aminotransferase [Bryobacteraceae bacterium]|nr:DegT/DnrJ/EryC1/StrS family aminotransferase [Bryobacteraceae bacterium]
MNVPLMDLKQQYAAIKHEILPAIQEVLESSQFVLGKEVVAFEEDFSDFCGVQHGVAVNTGTSALHLALLAAGVGPGDEVVTVPCTFVATVAAIVYTGATPVFVDVDPVTYTMDATKVEAAITTKTKVILPVHLYGNPADMDLILEIARRHNLVVVEDSAQAHAAEYHGRRCGSIGDMGCFSFYPGKNLGAYGEGGLVTTNNPDFAKKIRMLRDWGAEKKYEHVLKGFNYRMEGIQGAILRVKLRYLQQWTEARRAHAAAYRKVLAYSGLTLPTETSGSKHVYHVYAVLTDKRSEIAGSLNSQGVQTGIHYPYPIHLLPAHADLGYQAGDFPISERIASEELSLPMFPEMTDAHIQAVGQAVTEFNNSRHAVNDRTSLMAAS